MSFFCPACDCIATLEEIMVDVAVATTIISLDPGSEPEYGEQTNDGGKIERFQCNSCGFILRQAGGLPVIDYDQLEEWLKEHNPPNNSQDGEVPEPEKTPRHRPRLRGLTMAGDKHTLMRLVIRLALEANIERLAGAYNQLADMTFAGVDKNHTNPEKSTVRICPLDSS